MRGAVPCMDSRILGHQIRFAPGAHLLGEVGVLHIHEVVLIEAAHLHELSRPHRREAAGAELDLSGLGQIPVRHEVAFVVLCPELQAGQLAVDHGPHIAPAQRQPLGLPVRKGQGRAGHHHAGAFGYYKNIPLITLEGMVETENQNAYAIVEISQDHLLVKGQGRASSYSFKLSRQ